MISGAGKGVRRKNKKKNVDYSRYGWYFILPFIAVFLIFHLYPIIYSFQISFTDLKNFNTEYSYVGLDNYIRVLNTSHFWKALGNTLILFAMFFVVQLVLSLLLAYWFTTLRMKIRGQGIFKGLMYLPSIITPVSIGMLFNLFFEYPRGPVNTLLQNISLISEPVNFLQSIWDTRLLIVFVQIWVGYGPMMIMFIGAIIGLNPAMFEAANIDGCSSRQTFFRIVLPLIRPILLYNLICCTIGGLQIFDIPKIINGGGPRNMTLTMSMFVYNQAFSGSRSFNTAAAASYLMTVIMALVSGVLYLFLREKDEESVSKRRRKR